jgi:hypothetical protein
MACLTCSYPDGEGDVISVEVQCYDNTIFGSATIHVSSLSDTNVSILFNYLIMITWVNFSMVSVILMDNEPI